MIEYNVLLNEKDDQSKNFDHLISKIDDFQVIILYDRQPNHFDFNYLVNFPTDKLKKKIENNSIFPRIKSETFVVRQHRYEENFDLFYKLRIKARNEMLFKISEFMTAKFYSANENHLRPLLENKPTLKWDILNRLFSKYETMLEANTRLNDEDSWEGFIKLFKTYLVNHAIEEMVDVHGDAQLRLMAKKELNELFFIQMNKNFSSNDNFVDHFTDVVNVYIKKWISDVLVAFEIEKDSMKGINELLGISKPTIESQQFESKVKSNNFVVMSNPIYQFISEAISNREFALCEESVWPKATIQSNMLTGFVQLIPQENDCGPDSVHLIQELADNATELDVDVLDSLCHMYLTRCTPGTDYVEIRLDDLLKSRGLKTKLGGAGRRGGYEKDQRTQILKALAIIRNVRIEMDNVVVYEQGKPVKKSIQGRAFLFSNIDGSPYSFAADQACDTFLVRIGEAFEYFLKGSARQVKLLPNQAVEYNPYQRKWEKKLLRYLSWRWRTQARKASYLQPHKISTLLEKMGVDTDAQAPSRIRDRFEKALDLLADEGVITFWQYDNWDESCMAKKGWLRIWQEATIIIAPPEDIIKYYQPIERKKSTNAPTNFSLVKSKEEICKNIGLDFRESRIHRGLTLKQVSDELSISTSYISNIERGGALPSQNIYKKMKEWLI